MKNSLTSRIVGGQDAPSHIPWQAGLFFNSLGIDYLVCGATIIDEETVLTTTGCVVDYGGSFLGGTVLNKNRFKIIAGVVKRSDEATAQIKGISEIILHPCLR